MTNPDAIFSPDALAEHIRVLSGSPRLRPISARMIRAAIRRGELKASCPGARNLRIRWSDVGPWLERRRAAPSPDPARTWAQSEARREAAL